MDLSEKVVQLIGISGGYAGAWNRIGGSVSFYVKNRAGRKNMPLERIKRRIVNRRKFWRKKG